MKKDEDLEVKEAMNYENAGKGLDELSREEIKKVIVFVDRCNKLFKNTLGISKNSDNKIDMWLCQHINSEYKMYCRILNYDKNSVNNPILDLEIKYKIMDTVTGNLVLCAQGTMARGGCNLADAYGFCKVLKNVLRNYKDLESTRTEHVLKTLATTKVDLKSPKQSNKKFDLDDDFEIDNI